MIEKAFESTGSHNRNTKITYVICPCNWGTWTGRYGGTSNVISRTDSHTAF